MNLQCAGPAHELRGDGRREQPERELPLPGRRLAQVTTTVSLTATDTYLYRRDGTPLS